MDFAKKGIYSLEEPELTAQVHQASDDAKNVVWNTFRDQNAWMFERMSSEEIDAMFEVKNNQARIRPHLRQEITWICDDAGSSTLSAAIGPQLMLAVDIIPPCQHVAVTFGAVSTSLISSGDFHVYA